MGATGPSRQEYKDRVEVRYEQRRGLCSIVSFNNKPVIELCGERFL